MTGLVLPRRFALALIVAGCACGAFAAPAAAEFGPIQLVSKSAKEQADLAREPALSADGDYVAFYGRLGGHTGIFRKDLLTGAVILVDERTQAEEIPKAPSISAEGRYVSFTTKQSLDPTADPEAGTEDVYVADLATTPPTYELASAVTTAGHEERMSGSSSAAPRVALSAAGNEVAFVNEGEVYVREFAVPEPILISARRDPLTGVMTAEPVPGGGAYQPAGAALSADGNAIAWVGENLPEQVPMGSEEEAFLSEHSATPYREPLWRPVPSAVEESPPINRVVGPYPGLPHVRSFQGVGETQGFGWGTSLPLLSADGSTVATIGRPDEDSDVFMINMQAGIGRVGPVRQLTRWTNPAPSLPSPEGVLEQQYLPFTGSIQECAISPDGTHIAFTTTRQVFPLAPPTLITPPPGGVSNVTELYQINLDSQTIERATPGHAGLSLVASASVGGGAASPSYGAGDSLIAFASSAYNLVAGDANEESDVFVVESKPPARVEPSKISPRPSSISVLPVWRLLAHAVSRPDGTVRVVATVPGAGSLEASASSPLGARLHFRQVDAVRRRPGGAGVVRLDLALPRRLRGLSHRKGGLYTSLALHFTGPGGRPLQEQLAARFRAHKKKAKSKAGKQS